MKNITSSIFIFIALIITFNSCSDNSDTVSRVIYPENEILINGGITTKATDDQWASGDAIGVTVFDANYNGIVDEQFNKRYVTTQPLGTFKAASSDQTVYFPQTDDQIRLKAYYPYNSGLISYMQYPVSVADQSVLGNIDLMTAVHQQGFSKNDPNVKLHFYHRLSKLVFILSLEDEEDQVSLEDCKLTMSGFVTGNTYDIFNDAFMDMKEDIGDITVPLRAGESESQRQAIVLPRAAGKGIAFEFVTSTGATYKAYMSDDLALESGYKYTFNIVLSKNPITVTATIENWFDGSDSQLVAQ